MKVSRFCRKRHAYSRTFGEKNQVFNIEVSEKGEPIVLLFGEEYRLCKITNFSKRGKPIASLFFNNTDSGIQPIFAKKVSL